MRTTGPAPVTPVPGNVKGGVTVDQLVAIMPTLSRARAAEVLPYLNSAMAEANINTPLRQAAFLAQLAHESGGLRYFEEIASGAAFWLLLAWLVYAHSRWRRRRAARDGAAASVYPASDGAGRDHP